MKAPEATRLRADRPAQAGAPAAKRLPSRGTPAPNASQEPQEPLKHLKKIGVAASTMSTTAPSPASASKHHAAKVSQPLVRDGFTMPAADFALIAVLKSRAMAARREAKKSELLRAGLRALAAMPTASFIQALDQLERVKVGRPKKGR